MSEINLGLLKEAIATTALSHNKRCDCDVCRAANGDTDAWMRMVAHAINRAGHTETST